VLLPLDWPTFDSVACRAAASSHFGAVNVPALAAPRCDTGIQFHRGGRI
jgi:hypothetical protein